MRRGMGRTRDGVSIVDLFFDDKSLKPDNYYLNLLKDIKKTFKQNEEDIKELEGLLSPEQQLFWEAKLEKRRNLEKKLKRDWDKELEMWITNHEEWKKNNGEEDLYTPKKKKKDN